MHSYLCYTNKILRRTKMNDIECRSRANIASFDCQKSYYVSNGSCLFTFSGKKNLKNKKKKQESCCYLSSPQVFILFLSNQTVHKSISSSFSEPIPFLFFLASYGIIISLWQRCREIGYSQISCQIGYRFLPSCKIWISLWDTL